MADGNTDKKVTKSITLGTENVPVRTTHPSELRRHNISDEELEMLGDTKHDHLTEAMWAAVGGAVSSVAPAIADIHAAFLADRAPRALSGFALLEVVIFAIAATASACLGVVVAVRGKRANDLINRIRARSAT